MVDRFTVTPRAPTAATATQATMCFVDSSVQVSVDDRHGRNDNSKGGDNADSGEVNNEMVDQNPVGEAPAPPGSRTMLKYKVGIKQDDNFNLMRRLLVPAHHPWPRLGLIRCISTIRGR